jgi:hypothetical protein
VQALVNGAVSSLERQEVPELPELLVVVVPELAVVVPELPEAPEMSEVLEVAPELSELPQLGGVGTLAMSCRTDEMWPWADRYQAATVPLTPFPFVGLLCPLLLVVLVFP